LIDPHAGSYKVNVPDVTFTSTMPGCECHPELASGWNVIVNKTTSTGKVNNASCGAVGCGNPVMGRASWPRPRPNETPG